MAIANYNANIHTIDWVVSGARNITVDVGSGTDRMLLVLAYTDRDLTDGIITAATYNGASMTAGSASFYNSLLGYECRLFYLANPATGSNTLSISVGTDSTKCGAISAVYTGVKQDVGPGSVTSRASTLAGGATASFSQATNSGETAVWMHMSFDTGGSSKYTPGAGWSERLDNYGLVIDKDADPSSTTVNFVNNAGLISYNGVGMGLVPTGGGAGVPKTTLQTLLGVG